MEKVNISKLIRDTRLDSETPDSWLRWALIEGVVQAGGWEKVGVDCGKYEPNKPDTILDVEFKINGVEVNFSQTLTKLITSFNDDVQRTARNFIREEVSTATNRLHEVTSEFEQRLAKVGDEFEEELAKRGVKNPWKETSE